MKAYHIAQASKPSDLPEWLFDEKERGVTSRLPAEDGYEKTYDNPGAAPMPPSRQSAPSIPIPSKASTSTNPRRTYLDDEPATVSRASQRLREMREAKANPRAQVVDYGPSRQADGAAARELTRAMSVSRPEPSQASVVRSASVDVGGKRPLGQGLPSGVRPRRA